MPLGRASQRRAVPNQAATLLASTGWPALSARVKSTASRRCISAPLSTILRSEARRRDYLRGRSLQQSINPAGSVRSAEQRRQSDEKKNSRNLVWTRSSSLYAQENSTNAIGMPPELMVLSYQISIAARARLFFHWGNQTTPAVWPVDLCRFFSPILADCRRSRAYKVRAAVAGRASDQRRGRQQSWGGPRCCFSCSAPASSPSAVGPLIVKPAVLGGGGVVWAARARWVFGWWCEVRECLLSLCFRVDDVVPAGLGH